MRRLLAMSLIAAGLVSGATLSLRAADEPTSTAQAAHPSAGKQVAQPFQAGDKQMQYLLYLPPDYGKAKNQKYPLVLFLHGSGERGTDVHQVAKHGPPKLVAEGKEFPFILVSPQCPPNVSWQPAELKELLDDVATKYAADPDRLYLTGLSMGGFGTWAMAERYPDLFAAIVPICGGGDPAQAPKIAKLPIWVFHGEQDPVVPIKRSEVMVSALKKAGNNDVQFTHYPRTGHDSWVKAYADPKLYDWLLRQSRKAKSK